MMRDWLRTTVSAVCGGVILAMVVVELVVILAAADRGVNVGAVLLFGWIGLVALAVAVVCRRRDRTQVVCVDVPYLGEVLTSRGEAAETPDEPSDSCGCEGYGPGADDGAGYVWDDARLAKWTRKLVLNDRRLGTPAIPLAKDYVHLSEFEFRRWTEIVRAEFRPVPVVPGRERTDG